MDFSLTEEMEILKKSARDFLRQECPKAHVRAMESDGRGYSPELWRKMADLGWMGLALPKEYGGVGGTFLDLTVLLEEMGRALLPGPFVATAVCGALPILQYGTEKQKLEFLPKISEGRLVLTLALQESPDAALAVKARRAGKGYVLTGTKLFVPYAHVADWLLCTTKAAGGSSLFLVDARSEGLSLTVVSTLAADKQCEVVLDGVKVPAENILGEPGAAGEMIPRMQEWAALAQCGLISGYAQQVLEMSVDYAKQRVQFERPIGSFQAIQHQCADMFTDVDSVKLLTYEAAWALGATPPATVEIAMAKAWASDVARRVSLAGTKIHGGAGITVDHDMGLYFRRAKAAEVAFGDADCQREVLADQLGLPEC